MVRVIDQNDQFPSHLFPISGNSNYENITQSVTIEQQLSAESLQSFICILTDLTDASNTCKKHVINLSGSYTIEHLIREAANFYCYDPFTFNLFWVSGINNQMINLMDIQQTSLTLTDLGLTSKKNRFEIHEKEDGPPKRISKSVTFNDDFGYNQQQASPPVDNLVLEPINYTSLIKESFPTGTYQPRRNGISINDTVTSLCPATSMGLTLPTTYNSNYEEEENTGFVGLINQAMTCYLNSLIQTLYMTPEFRNGIYRWKSTDTSLKVDDDENSKKNIPFQLQRLFLNLQTSNKKSIQTHDLTKSFGWNSEDAFQQHDVQELCRVMFDALEKMFKNTQQNNFINELYQGRIKDYVKCLECETESARVDVYLDIPLCIRPFGSDKTFQSVEEALDAFVQPETLDENNQYFCTKCNKMCRAHKGLKFQSFPYILSLQLKRFDFDYNTMSRFKLSNSVSFPEILNVKKYLNLDEEEKESSITQPLCDYELFSIMIHSGSATGGHYYAYIKSFDTDQWYNFNDEKVTKLDKCDISKAFGTSYSMYSSATAYMLLYRQINPSRNENFIKLEESKEDHIKQSLEIFKKQQIEADALKEYMENVCKVKVIVADSVQDCSGINIVYGCLNKREEKTVNIHKNLTLEKAKLEIAKEFGLNPENKYRLLKYDTYNDLIEQSYNNENELTVFEAVGFTKFPYNFCWYLQVVTDTDINTLVEYKSSDYKVKVMQLNVSTYEVVDLFSLRLKENARVSDLQRSIAEKIVDFDLNRTEKISMAYEKTHAVFNYVYLNQNIKELLKSLNFSRVSKVFIEIEASEEESAIPFQESKFFQALDALANLINISAYLPNQEQCESFKIKTQRRLSYIRQLQEQKQNLKINEDLANFNQDTSSLMSIQATDINNSNNASKLDQTNYDAVDVNMIDYDFNEKVKKSLEATAKFMHDSDGGDDNDDVDNETHLGDVIDRCDVDLADLDSDWAEDVDTNTELNIDENTNTNILSQDYNLMNENNTVHGDGMGSDELSEINPNSLFDFKYKVYDSSLIKQRVKFDMPERLSEGADVSDDVKLPESLNSIFSGLNAEKNKRKEEIKDESLCKNRCIKSSLSVNEELGTRILETTMDKRISLDGFKSHVNEFLNIGNDNFRVFRISQNDAEYELTSHDNQFFYTTQNTKLMVKLGPPLKYGEYVLPVFKVNKLTGSITYLCDFMVIYEMNVLSHKEMLKEDLKDECNLEVDIDRMRLRKKISKRPGNILVNNQIFGKDIFVNPTSELCIELLEEPEKKLDSKLHTSVYLRHWRPDEYCLGDLFEIVLNGNSFEILIDQISLVSGIALADLEVFKCKRDYPFKSPLLEIHRDPNWKTNSYIRMETLDDGVCFYYRNKNSDLRALSEEKRRNMEKTDNINFRPTSNYKSTREKGVRIQVENN